MSLTKELTRYWESQCESTNRGKSNWIVQKRQFHKKRGNNVPRITGLGTLVRRLQLERHELKVNYLLRATFLVKQGSFFYHEEQVNEHEALFYKGKFIEDKLLKANGDQDHITLENKRYDWIDTLKNDRFTYDRMDAVNYAERWWDDYNPAYKHFDVDCTNFISQALHAGGAPMRGYPSRSKGWWYQNDIWSYSWAVAHSLRWYLSGSTQGLRGKELDDPTELLPGDVICYDFEGDGKWDHNTIVVMKDQNKMPLVNAHTNNSRHRYWSYEDSYAWTPECQYKFFRIGDL
ncbi:amidase domain-containing protein [Paraliobacillus sp. JSM ZJ581]|uniref:amidase domain-containing protein n=1 Tax=Paraliobacillus sp. JSM ZJ581 TaxID=3342118 RepID=UPI0035A93C0E